METIVIPKVSLNNDLLNVRSLSKEEWIEKYASGTLRHSHKLQLRTNSLYLEERTAFEFGWEFCCVPTSRVTFNDVMAEGDCHAITELVWHLRRIKTLSRFAEDEFQAKYFHLSTDDSKKEGIGILLSKTSAPWVPAGHIIFAFTTLWDGQRWLESKNPC